jgi:hypothetical protein
MNSTQRSRLHALDAALASVSEKLDDIFVAFEENEDFKNSELGSTAGYVEDRMIDLQNLIHTYLESNEL